jgi:hypothetical protein
MATIEEVLVPLYFYHRYQVEAAVKVIGGQWYSLALRGDGQTPVRAVSPADQRKALESVLATIRPEFLALPRPLLAIIPPRPAGYETTRELFDREDRALVRRGSSGQHGRGHGDLAPAG